MSSILKALKKLEDEKPGRLSDPVRIDSDILKSINSPRKNSPLVSAALILLIFGGGSAATYIFTKDQKAEQQSSKQQAAPAAQKPPSPALPLIKTETLPAEIAVVPSSSSSAAKEPISQPKKKDANSKAINSVVKKASNAAIPVTVTKTDTTQTTLKPAVEKSPVLRVNGIAYQNNSADSLAIVNGTAVSNGSTIDGAVIEEVRKDRVVFQRNGEKFEILLGQSNP
jgi:hypothetical protein